MIGIWNTAGYCIAKMYKEVIKGQDPYMEKIKIGYTIFTDFP